jgi:hypothetical protein
MANEYLSLSKRLLGEAIAIFVGVAVALGADDWRETRSERQEAEESLALVLVDLHLDSVEFADLERAAREHSNAADWLIRGWDREDHQVDSLESVLYAFSTWERLQLSRAGFEGLLSANRLRLIEGDSIRFGLQRYYQVSQIHQADYYELVVGYRAAVLASLAPHVRNLEGVAAGSVWPPREDRVTLRHSWREVAADAVLHNYLVWLGRGDDFLALELAKVQEEVGALMAAIRGVVDAR